MKKQVTATFSLTQKEIKEALYEYFVRKLSANRITTDFTENDIKLDFNDLEDRLATLVIHEERDID